MIFVDTGAWFASVVPWDQHHRAANDWLRDNKEPLLTTDYVVDESLSLLRFKGESARAIALGTQFFAGTLATVHDLSRDELLAAWSIFQSYADKDWSFTDCTSFALIQKLGIASAFSFDHHFRQFGSVQVVPKPVP